MISRISSHIGSSSRFLNGAPPPLTPSISPTPSVTLSITPSMTPSISRTPSITLTPSISSTPTVTLTPSVSRTPSLTPTLTPSVSRTPSLTPSYTPSITPSSSVPGTGFTTSGLILELDASDSSSYPGSGTLWTDTVNGYNGTLTNGPTYSSSDGGVIQLDGNDDYIEIADTTGLRGSIGGVLTLQIWAKITSYANADGLFGKQFGNIGGYDGYSVALWSNEVFRIQMNGSTVNGGYNSANNVWTTNTWHLFTAVIAFGGSVKGYVDTTNVISVSNAESSIPNNNASLRIGLDIQEGSRNPVMNVGAFYVYNRELTSQEITNNYNNTKSRYGL